jgi:hypothetical protein
LYSLHNQKLLEKSNQKKIVQESKALQEINSLTPGKQQQEEEEEDQAVLAIKSVPPLTDINVRALLGLLTSRYIYKYIYT